MVHFWYHGTFFSTRPGIPHNPSGSCILFPFLLIRCFVKPKRRRCPAEKSVYGRIFIMNRNNKVSFCLFGHRSIISALSRPYISSYMNCVCDLIVVSTFQQTGDDTQQAESEAFKQTIARQEGCAACVCGCFKISGES